MGVAIVSGPTVRQNSPAITQNFSISTTGSGQRLCVLVIASYATTSGTSSVSDNVGNTWSKITNSSHASLQQRVEIWYTITSGSITSITVTEAASHAVSVIFYEVSGFDTTTPIRASANGNDTTSDTTWAMGTYNRVAGGEILLIHGSSSPNITLSTVTPPLNYTTGGIAGGGATTQAGNTVHRIHTTTTGTYGGNETTNLASTNGWAYVVINGAADVTASMPSASASSDTYADSGSTGTGGATGLPDVSSSSALANVIVGTGGSISVVPVGGIYQSDASASGMVAAGGATASPPVSPSLFAAYVASYITEAIKTLPAVDAASSLANTIAGTGGATAIVGVASATGDVYLASASLDLYVSLPVVPYTLGYPSVATASGGSTKAFPIASGSALANSIAIAITVPISVVASGSASASAVVLGISVTVGPAELIGYAQPGTQGYHWFVSEVGSIIRTEMDIPLVASREEEQSSVSVSRTMYPYPDPRSTI